MNSNLHVFAAIVGGRRAAWAFVEVTVGRPYMGLMQIK
jgi:hypothetical protein